MDDATEDRILERIISNITFHVIITTEPIRKALRRIQRRIKSHADEMHPNENLPRSQRSRLFAG